MSETLTETPAKNYVGGEWRESASGDSYEKRSPWQPSRVTGVYPASDAADGRAAVEAARARLPRVGGAPARAAGRLLRQGRDCDRGARRADRAGHDGRDGQAAARGAHGGGARRAAILRFAAGEAWRPIGEVYAPSVPSQRLYTLRRPLGVVALITPWNFPIAIPVWKLAPALIYGNTVVLKLGYEAPRTGLHVAEAFAEAGLPAGVLNVAHRRRLEGRSRARPQPATCARSRSPARCRSAARCATRRPRRNCRVQLELGGQNPLVVMADAELDRAVEAAYAGAFWSAGQKCTATRRILVQDAVYDDFRERLLARIDAGKVGDPPTRRSRSGPS